MRYLKKILLSKPFIIVVAVLLVYTLAGFLLAPYLVGHYVPKVVRESLKKTATVGEVRVNPFLFTLEAKDFRMAEPDGGPIAGFNRLFIDFELKSLFKWAWTFRQVSLDGLGINAVIRKDGSLNLASLAPPSGESPEPDDDGQFPRMIFEDLSIQEGRFQMEDRRPSKPASITISPLNLQMKDLTTLPGQEGAKTITASTAGGERFKWSGSLSLNPVGAKGRVSIEDLKVSTLSQFAMDALNIEQPEGKLSVAADYKVDLAGESPQVQLADLRVGLTGIGLKLKGEEAPFLELPDTQVSGGRVDLSGRQVDVGRIAIKGGRARLLKAEDGTLNVQRIAAAPTGSGPAAGEPSSREKDTKPWKVTLAGFDVDGFGLDYRDLGPKPGMTAAVDQIHVGLKAEAEAGSTIKALVHDMVVGVTGIRLGFADAEKPAVRLDTVGLEAGAYDLAGNRFTAESVSVKGGSADVQRKADGTLNLMQLFGQPKKEGAAGKQEEASTGNPAFSFLLKTVSVSGLQVAFSDLTVQEKAPVLNLEDVSGTVSDVDGRSPMNFDLGVKIREGGQIKAAGKVDPSGPSVESEVQVADLDLVPFQPYIDKAASVVLRSGTFSTRGTLRHGTKAAGAQTVYRGGFNVEKLRITETDGKETLLGWKSVKADQIKLQLEPNGIEVEEIRVSEPAGKIIIAKDGSLNLAKVIRSEAEPKKEETKAAASPSAGFPYHVRRVMVGAGRFEFADLSLPMPFGTRIHELKGSVAGISSVKNARARMKLDGRVDDYGTAKVDGEVNTSDPKAFTHISVVFRNVEISRLTPYSGKFAGRKIDSGKLSVDLKYKIDNSQLAGDNKIVVERLKLGEKVESPDAVSLPLDLAVALLEDSNGVIDLGLPVKGSLDSPEFSYGALIGKAIVNLLTKIVTSPFRALASLVPGGGEETLKNVAFEPGSAEVPPPEKEKLAKLAGALEKRPQLKLAVRGRYNPETDRAVLRTEALSRALAAQMGQKLGPDMDPGPVDFNSPQTGKALEAMFLKRFGADALKALKAELKGERQKAKKEEPPKDKPVPPREEVEDPGRLAKVLFTRLEQAEPVDDAALTRLADARTKAVIAELSGPLSIPSERLGVKASAALETTEPVTAELSLEVGR